MATSALFALKAQPAARRAMGARVGVAAKAVAVRRAMQVAKGPVAVANTGVVGALQPRAVAVASAVRAVGAPAKVAVGAQKVADAARSSLPERIEP
jgi:predicted methyltransferase MtxX (methanogen marker protein 4)